MRIRFSAAAIAAGFAFFSAPRASRAGGTRAGSDPVVQKAPCDAKCRQDYQGNSAAINACIRNCGVGGAASAQTNAQTSHSNSYRETGSLPSGSRPAEASSVKSSKSNSSDRVAGTPSSGAQPAAATNLNLSRSNSYREAASSDSGSQPVKSTTVKSSKSNSSDRVASTPSSGAQPAEAINLNSSKSNANRKKAPPKPGAKKSPSPGASDDSQKKKE